MPPVRLLRSARPFPLQDVSEPNLLRDEFPYTHPPLITWDFHDIPLDLPGEIWITDTTFRDGQQAREPYAVAQIVEIYDRLHRLAGPPGIIRQCEFFLYTEKDKEAVRRCLERGYRYPEVTGWIRAVKSDFKLVRDMGLKETGILTSGSDYHIFTKLGKTRRQALDGYLEVVRAALEAGVLPRCHFEDATRADVYGFLIPFAIELMKLGDEAKVPIKIRICDTMGFGLPWAQATLPRSVPKLVRAFVEDAGVPRERLEWHGHNDFHKTVANATAAWLYGCASVNGTLFSTGERTGNTPIEAMIFEYLQLMGGLDGVDTTVISELATYYRETVGLAIPDNYPFVGRNFNVTMAGIHADGLIKNEEIYNIFDTTTLLSRPVGVTINDKSGVAGVAYWANQTLGFRGDRRMDKRDPRITAIYEELMVQYHQGRTTGMAHEEMLTLAKKHLPDLFR